MDQRLAAALAEPAALLAALVESQHWSLAALAGHLLPLSVAFEGSRELAERSLVKLTGRDYSAATHDQLANFIGAVKSVYLRERPGVLDELSSRSGPLREQWQACGPGVLVQVARRCPTEFLVDSADLALLQPVLGGAGTAHPLYNSASIEAVLTNPIADLPEVCRLAWLVAQLQLDRPDFQGDEPRERALWLGAMGLVPVVLSAAAEVELIRYDERLLGSALERWFQGQAYSWGPVPEPAAVPTLLSWYEVYSSRRPSWPAAMRALAQMLTDESADAQQGSAPLP